MSNSTRNAIKASFAKLLDERPLSQITVKAIVSDCGVNRNTFYYYFSDIPQLIEDVIMEDTEELIRVCSSIDKIEDCLGTLIDSAIAKKKAVLHIYHSANREIYETYLWKICDHVVNAYVDTVLGGRKISERDLGIIKKYLSDVGYGLVSGVAQKRYDGGHQKRLCKDLRDKKGHR